MTDREEVQAAVREAAALKREAREARDARIRELAAAGMSMYAIQRRMGCVHSVVAKAVDASSALR